MCAAGRGSSADGGDWGQAPGGHRKVNAAPRWGSVKPRAPSRPAPLPCRARAATHLSRQLQHPQLCCAVQHAPQRRERRLGRGRRALQRPARRQVVGPASRLCAAEGREGLVPVAKGLKGRRRGHARRRGCGAAPVGRLAGRGRLPRRRLLREMRGRGPGGQRQWGGVCTSEQRRPALGPSSHARGYVTPPRCERLAPGAAVGRRARVPLLLPAGRVCSSACRLLITLPAAGRLAVRCGRLYRRGPPDLA